MLRFAPARTPAARFGRAVAALSLAWLAAGGSFTSSARAGQPPPAPPADLPRIAVVGLHQASLSVAAQQAAAEQIGAAIESGGAYDALGPSDVAGALTGRAELVLEEGLLGSARAALQGGKNAYNQASPDDAIALLMTAIEDYRGVFPGILVVDEVWESWVYLGTSHLQRDPPDELAARSAFSAAVALSPTRPLNPALYPPNVVELFGEVQADLAPHGVKLDIASEQPVEVFVDGAARGTTPAVVTGVLPGEHFVVGRGDGTEAFARLDVGMPGAAVAGDTVGGISLSVQLSPSAPILGEPAGSPVGRSTQTADLYSALGRRAQDLDYVLVGGVIDGSLSLQLLHVASNTYSKPIALPVAGEATDEAVQAVPLLLGAIGPAGTFTATAAAPEALDIGANSLLALILDGQVAPTVTEVPVVGPPVVIEKKSKLGLVLGIVGGVVAASAAGGGTYLIATSGPPDPADLNHGVIAVQF